eukprot:jgi/Psemu1/17856/gm1.17856_g
MEKKGKGELMRKGMDIDNQTSKHTLQEIANVEKVTVEEMLDAHNILKDDGQKIPATKIQRVGRNNVNYKDGGSDDNANENKYGNKRLDNESDIDTEVETKAVVTVPQDKSKIDATKNKVIAPIVPVKVKKKWKAFLGGLASLW